MLTNDRTWMRRLPWSGLVLMLAAACQGQAVTLEGESDDSLQTGGGSSGSDAGMCQFKPEPAFGPYGYCSPVDDYAPDYENHCLGSSMHSWSPTGPDGCPACRCLLDCTEDADCPTPESGDAIAVCGDSGSCHLPCDGETTCPDGMRCVEHEELGYVCAYSTDKESSLACAFNNGSNLCAELSTKESCEARFESDPRQPVMACVWATERLYSTAKDSCKPVSETQKCIAAERRDGQVAENAPNRCGQVSAFWSDLGAGTAALLMIERCGYAPYEPAHSYQDCEIGDPSVPLLCDCAC